MPRLPILFGLILLLRVTPALAQTGVNRCINANGRTVFTDQPCFALHATPVAPAAITPNPGTSLPAAASTLCAASLNALRKDVIDAFAGHDPNRLAGLMLWDGYGHDAAIADIHALGELMKQPLLGVDIPGDPGTPAPPASHGLPPLAPASAVPPPNTMLVVHVAGNGNNGSPHDLHFNVVNLAGCLWLRNAD